MSDDESGITLEDAPLLGVLVEVSELWERLQQGAASAGVVDFYGEYNLVMESRGGVVALENELGGGRVSAPLPMFVAAVGVWSTSLLMQIEEAHPSLIQNAAYTRLKSFVQAAWVAGAVATD